MKEYISVNIVAQSLLLGKSIKNNDCHTIENIRQLRLPYGINLNSSLDFAMQCQWVSNVNADVVFTDNGNNIIEMFDGQSISMQLWRRILYIYITVCSPAWCRRIPYGRREAYLFMNEEEQRCFEEAGLVDSQDESVIDWWDTLANEERNRSNAALGDIGRRGERLTMAYEELRTGVKPNWRSIETNLSGYDILSQRSSNEKEKLLIEVKTSNQQLETACANISRHEWNVAVMKNNRSRYFFYFWALSGHGNRLAIINVDEMSNHIPEDNESGKWENVNIPFNAFREMFENCEL